MTGKGGTGKSLLSVVLANSLSRRGKTILYFPSAFPSPLYEFVSKNVVLYPIDYEKEAKEYVKIKLKFFLFWFPFVRSSIFRVFSKVIPGFYELILLGKMWYDWYNNAADFYVFDGLPIGQIVSLFRVPKAGVESGIGGPVKDDMMKMVDFTYKINLIITTLPEILPYEETREFVEILKNEGLKPRAICLNKFYTRKLSDYERKWVEMILIEGKLKKKERKQLSQLLDFENFLYENSQKFLRVYSELGFDVFTLDFSIRGIDHDFVRKQEEKILQSSIFSHLS